MSARDWLVSCALLCMSCDGVWPASMERQPSVRPLDEARPAPRGSIPLGGVETLDDREDDADLHSPYPLDGVASARGAAIFAVHCVPCHGPEGRGDGPVSAKFPPAPNLRHVSICRRTDGFLYGTLTAGGRAMPLMREGTTARDRWDLVAYVRSLQREGCTGSAAGMGDPGAAAVPPPPAAAPPPADKGGPPP